MAPDRLCTAFLGAPVHGRPRPACRDRRELCSVRTSSWRIAEIASARHVILYSSRTARAPRAGRLRVTCTANAGKEHDEHAPIPPAVASAFAAQAAETSELAVDTKVIDSKADKGDARLLAPSFRRWRWRVFAGLYAAYLLYSFTRSTFTFVAPSLRLSGFLTLSEVGTVASMFPMAYGVSKLLSGAVADNASPRAVLSIGLLLSGLTNVAMSLSSTVPHFAVGWMANGAVQGVGAGAVARMLTSWYTLQERGFWWSLWSTSANAGGFIAPLLCSWLVSARGWRASLFVPGVWAMLFGVLLLPLLRDTPEAIGYLVRQPSADRSTRAASSKGERGTNFGTALGSLLLNRQLWCLAAANFFIYFVRTGLRSWHHFYLADVRNISVVQAAYRVSGMEIGGLIGTFSSGIISDRSKGGRIPVIAAFLVGLLVTLVVCATGRATWAVLDLILIAALGFFINGPQCLVGLLGAEIVDRRTVATATGILGWVSYLGAAVAGAGLSAVVRVYGWSAYLSLLGASSALALLLTMTLWRPSDGADRK